jgi:hypothetical protein
MPEQDDLQIRPEPQASEEKPAVIFSTEEKIILSIIALLFDIIALLEVTNLVLVPIEGYYYHKKGIGNTVILLNIAIDGIAGAIPFANWIPWYLGSFWVIVRISKKAKLKAVTEKAGAIAAELEGKGGGASTTSAPGGPNAASGISHEVSPTDIQHEVAPPAESETAAVAGERPDRNRSQGSKPPDALTKRDEDLFDSGAADQEALFNESPASPFETERQREAEEEAVAPPTPDKTSKEEAKDRDVENRANTGKAFLENLERDLNNPVESGKVVGEETAGKEGDKVEQGETVDLKHQDLSR